MSCVVIGGTNVGVGQMSGGTNVGRTNVGGKNVGGRKVAPPHKCDHIKQLITFTVIIKATSSVYFRYSWTKGESRFPLYSSDLPFPYHWYNSQTFEAEIGNELNNNRRVMIKNKFMVSLFGNESGLCDNIL